MRTRQKLIIKSEVGNEAESHGRSKDKEKVLKRVNNNKTTKEGGRNFKRGDETKLQNVRK